MQLNDKKEIKTRKVGYKPIQYYLLSFGLTWFFWLIASTAHQTEIKVICLLIGLGMPFLVALTLIIFSKNVAMKREFSNKLLNVRLIHKASLFPIFLLPISSILIAILLSLVLGFSVEQFQFSSSFSFNIGISTLLMLLLAASLEELGWRGYGVESLNRFNYFNASLIFGILWSIWHFPLFFITGTYQHEILQSSIFYAANFMISIVPLAFIVGWVCKKNSGSILAAILFHFIINISQELFMVAPETKCLQTGVLLIYAVIVICWDKNIFFETRPKLPARVDL